MQLSASIQGALFLQENPGTLLLMLEVIKMSKKLSSEARKATDLFTVVHLINLAAVKDRSVILRRAEGLGYLPSGKKVVLAQDPMVESAKQMVVSLNLETDLRDEAIELATQRIGHRSIALEAMAARATEVETALGVKRRGREIDLVRK